MFNQKFNENWEKSNKSKVICNECNDLFKINIITEHLPRGVQRVYFTCPFCMAEYTSYVTNKNIRAKQKELRRLWIKHTTDKNKGKTEKAEHSLILIEKLKKEVSEEMDELKNEISLR